MDARARSRAHGATAEPAAGARGMQYPVESNGTFMETAHQHTTSSQSSCCTGWSHFGSSRLEKVSVYPKDF